MKIEDVNTIQGEYFQRSGKYKQIKTDESKSADFYVHEYEGPLGKGFIVFEEKDQDGKRMIKSTDYGPEQRSFDWKIKEDGFNR